MGANFTKTDDNDSVEDGFDPIEYGYYSTSDIIKIGGENLSADCFERIRDDLYKCGAIYSSKVTDHGKLLALRSGMANFIHYWDRISTLKMDSIDIHDRNGFSEVFHNQLKMINSLLSDIEGGAGEKK